MAATTTARCDTGRSGYEKASHGTHGWQKKLYNRFVANGDCLPQKTTGLGDPW
jgi:hypothetical protein